MGWRERGEIRSEKRTPWSGNNEGKMENETFREKERGKEENPRMENVGVIVNFREVFSQFSDRVRFRGERCELNRKCDVEIFSDNRKFFNRGIALLK